MEGSRPPDRLVHDGRGDLHQLLVPLLTQGAHAVHGLGLGPPSAAHHDAERSVDHSASTQRRLELEAEPGFLDDVLRSGNARANEVAEATLDEVRAAMGMVYV